MSIRQRSKDYADRPSQAATHRQTRHWPGACAGLPLTVVGPCQAACECRRMQSSSVHAVKNSYTERKLITISTHFFVFLLSFLCIMKKLLFQKSHD